MKKFLAFLKAQWQKPQVRHIFSFLLFGGLTTLINFGLYTGLTRLLEWESLPANITAVVCSILFAYITNKLFVFHSKTGHPRALLTELLSFFGGRAFTMLLDVGGLYLLHEVLLWNDLLSKLLITVLVVALNYLISRFLVFQGRRKQEVS